MYGYPDSCSSSRFVCHLCTILPLASFGMASRLIQCLFTSNFFERSSFVFNYFHITFSISVASKHLKKQNRACRLDPHTDRENIY